MFFSPFQQAGGLAFVIILLTVMILFRNIAIFYSGKEHSKIMKGYQNVDDYEGNDE